jgi:hypothetical protein
LNFLLAATRLAAALLIQGSTCVYSRKVEYLHKLVYNALEAVASKRRAPTTPARTAVAQNRVHLACAHSRAACSAAANRRASADADNGDGGDGGDVEDEDDVAKFLGLDDVLQGAECASGDASNEAASRTLLRA